MKLIADSGGTKTAWRVLDGNHVYKDVTTAGLNPYYKNSKEIRKVIETNLCTQISVEGINNIYFYGAGCSSEEGCNKISNELKVFFPNAHVEVTHDLLGVARALCNRAEGIACILGTGSNSCRYDGVRIVENIPSLGYVLGDEGGGSHMGKIVLRDFIRGEMPENLSSVFLDTYHLEKSEIEKNVYLKKNPIGFLSGFSHFLSDHLDDPYVQNLVYNSFTKFLKKCVSRYERNKELPVHFVGGIAYNFQIILREAMQDLNFNAGKILNNPVDGLTQYHM